MLSKKNLEERINKLKNFLFINNLNNNNYSDLICISASNNFGVNLLLEKIKEYLPEGELFYPDDVLTDKPVRFITSELIREQCMNCLGDEIPYSVAVKIQEFKEPDINSNNKITRITAEIILERESQKKIVIGKNGSKIKEIGTKSRISIEKLIEQKVFLDLRVRVSENWRKNSQKLENLGYTNMT